MWIKVKIKSEKHNTPYRVFINDELMTERFYTAPKNWTENNKITETWNTLGLEIADAEDYTATVENVPGHPKARVWIEEVQWQEERYEN